jgi:hypothetical protein
MVLFLASGATAGVGTLADSNGQVVAWGDNGYGQTTVPAGLSNVTAIAGGVYHSLALKSDGTVAAWGPNWLTTVPAGLSGVTAIAGGRDHSLALKSDGTVTAWGYNGYGQTTVPAGLSGVTAIAGGIEHSLALKSDGTVAAWGSNMYGQTTVPAGLSGVTAIAAGFAHNLALKSDGTVAAWGYNAQGQTTVPAGLSGVTAIAAGHYHNLALKSDGTVAAWGYNAQGQTTVPAGLSNVTAIAGGYGHSLALKSDGTIAAWGYNGYGLSNVPSGVFVAIGAGGEHSLALGARTAYDGDLLVSGTGIRANLNRSVTVDGNAVILSPMYLYNNPTMTVAGRITLLGSGSILGAGDIQGALDLSSGGTIAGSGAGLMVHGPLSGSGTVSDATLFGNLSPGHNAGQVVLNDVALTSGMTTFMELGGTSAGASDHIILEGLTTLDGALDLTLLGGFAPREGDTFDLFDGTINGTFEAVNLPALGGGLAWHTGRLYTDGTLTVVPEPATMGLLCLGAMGMLLRRRVAPRTDRP